MTGNTGANWYVNNYPGGVGNPSAPAYGAGGGTDMLAARSPLDAKRQAAGFAPGASYPDGYLGNITDRQSDKMQAALGSRLTSTSYQRGVHAGSLQPKSAYYWEAGFNPNSGLERQMQAVPVNSEGAVLFMTPKMAPTGDPVEMIANDGKLAGATSREVERALTQAGGDPAKNPTTVIDPSRAAKMSTMLPRWSGVRPGAI
jgi:hypothetical protein